MKRTAIIRLLIGCSLVGISISISAQKPEEILSADHSYNKPLQERWELSDSLREGTFKIQSYKPIYVTAGRYSNSPNKQPQSENPDYSLPFPIDYNNYEAKFQLSLKTKVLQGIFGNYGDLWMAFTQKAHWQIYNANLSRPFRELNYEPEIFFIFPLNIRMSQAKLHLVGFGFNHQSNGRALPVSRSWNRIVFRTAVEMNQWEVQFKPWIRIPDEDDENPEITNYIGRAEFDVSYRMGKHLLYAVITHPFNRLDRGSIELNYVFPIKGDLQVQIQAFSGYGETLIDYNHRQTTIGIGISFFDI